MSHRRVFMEGFISEMEYRQQYRGIYRSISHPVTGHFTQEIDKPETMQLYDDFTRMLHPLTRVTMAWPSSNPLEGKKKFPRPFLYDKTGADAGSLGELKTVGDKVLIQFLGGSVWQPVVIASLEQLGIPSQKAFLRVDGDQIDRQMERYENDEYVLEFDNNGAGLLSFTLQTKTSDPIKIQLESDTILVAHLKDDGSTLQHILMARADGIRLQGQLDEKNEHAVYGETLKDKMTSLIEQLESLIDAIGQITVGGVTTGPGFSGPIVNSAVFPPIKSQITTIKNELEEILVR